MSKNTNIIAGGEGFMFRNRIINGDFRIDQRNEGTSVTPTAAVYTLDRWLANCSQSSKYSVQQVTGITLPIGGTNTAVRITSLGSYTPLSGETFNFSQLIEAINTVDMAQGTSNAKTVTLSFWVYSSITGTFPVSIFSAANLTYLTTYTITTVNAWQYVTITFPGSTTGTWNVNPGTFLFTVQFCLGAGSSYKTSTTNSWISGNFQGTSSSTQFVSNNGAILLFTQVQLEVGTQATPFEQRPYATELALCQRYFEKSYDRGSSPGSTVSANNGAAGGVVYSLPSAVYEVLFSVPFKVTKMSSPSVTTYSPTSGVSGKIKDYVNNADVNYQGSNTGYNSFQGGGTLSAASTSYNLQFHWTASAEL